MWHRGLVWLIVAPLACGCGGSTPDLVDVSGMVTFQGQPIKEGEIRFIPTAETLGPVSGGTITDGWYAAEGIGGVPVGTHRVEITAFASPRGAQPDPNVPFTQKEQYLPGKYNTQSELELAIPSGSRPIEKNFDLQP